MKEFKIGDIVRTTMGSGRIVAMKQGQLSKELLYLVEFDSDKQGGHDGGGLCRKNRGWWYFAEALYPSKHTFAVGDIVDTMYGRGAIILIEPDLTHLDLFVFIKGGKIFWVPSATTTLVHRPTIDAWEVV